MDNEVLSSAGFSKDIFYRAMLELPIDSAVVLLDSEQNIQEFSLGAARLWGLIPKGSYHFVDEAVVGLPFSSLTLRKSRETVLESLKKELEKCTLGTPSSVIVLEDIPIDTWDGTDVLVVLAIKTICRGGQSAFLIVATTAGNNCGLWLVDFWDTVSGFSAATETRVALLKKVALTLGSVILPISLWLSPSIPVPGGREREDLGIPQEKQEQEEN